MVISLNKYQMNMFFFSKMGKWVYDGNGLTEKIRVKLDQILEIV